MASYVAPEMEGKFETLPIGLKDEILDRDVRIESIFDLIKVLEDIVDEGEG